LTLRRKYTLAKASESDCLRLRANKLDLSVIGRVWVKANIQIY